MNPSLNLLIIDNKKIKIIIIDTLIDKDSFRDRKYFLNLSEKKLRNYRKPRDFESRFFQELMKLLIKPKKQK